MEKTKDKKDKEEINVLDELHKGACMGMDAISFILEKVEDEDFRKTLENQYNGYKDIASKIENLYPEYSEKEPHETSTMNKVMTWWGIEMKTMSDDTTSKLAELIMQGTNMGIIEGRRLLNQKDTEKQVEEIAQEYVAMQEADVEDLKKYL